MIRTFDIVFSIFALIVTLPLLILVYIVNYWSCGSPIFKQSRLGIYGSLFTIFKFRTLNLSTADMPSHLLAGTEANRFGKLLRVTKIDELPQLINVIKGDMSLIGPRPCLPSQIDVIKAREKYGVFSIRPGISGIAQLKGIDMGNPQLLARLDAIYIRKKSLFLYFSLIFSTILRIGWIND